MKKKKGVKRVLKKSDSKKTLIFLGILFVIVLIVLGGFIFRDKVLLSAPEPGTEGWGDCDSDSDCNGGLFCLSRANSCCHQPGCICYGDNSLEEFNFGVQLYNIGILSEWLSEIPGSNDYTDVCVPIPDYHSTDTNLDWKIDLSELLRVIQFYDSDGYHCQDGTEDGYAPGSGIQNCEPHDSDYDNGDISSQDWKIDLSELLRMIQFFNYQGYYPCPDEGTEDGFCVFGSHEGGSGGLVKGDECNSDFNCADGLFCYEDSLGYKLCLPETGDFCHDTDEGNNDPGEIGRIYFRNVNYFDFKLDICYSSDDVSEWSCDGFTPIHNEVDCGHGVGCYNGRCVGTKDIGDNCVKDGDCKRNLYCPDESDFDAYYPFDKTLNSVCLPDESQGAFCEDVEIGVISGNPPNGEEDYFRSGAAYSRSSDGVLKAYIDNCNLATSGLLEGICSNGVPEAEQYSCLGNGCLNGRCNTAVLGPGCTSDNPCSAGEGNCKAHEGYAGNDNCKDGLICHDNIGGMYPPYNNPSYENYANRWSIDVCETWDMYKDTVQPGQINYCTAKAEDGKACGLEEGDCNPGIGDCEAGLYCKEYFGDSPYYPGTGGWVDVCLPNPELGDYNYCGVMRPNGCVAGEGDCRNDDDCAGELLCHDDAGGYYPVYNDLEDNGDISDDWAVGVCENWTTYLTHVRPWYRLYCNADNPCDEGMGDCDDHDGCAGDLICAGNVGANYRQAGWIDVCEVGDPGTPEPNPDNSCFPAGSKVLMSNGFYKNIEDVVVGDLVVSYDELAGETAIGKVLELEAPVRDHMCEIVFGDGSELKLTNEHPVYTSEGWKSISPLETARENIELEVYELGVGDDVLFENEAYKEIEEIDCWNEEVQTYNLKTIEGYNNFYVEDVLVHNKGGGGNTHECTRDSDCDPNEECVNHKCELKTVVVINCTADVTRSCSDGSTIILKRCLVNGSLQATGNTCPPVIECTEDEVDECEDGMIVVIRKCVDGSYVDTGNSCEKGKSKIGLIVMIVLGVLVLLVIIAIVLYVLLAGRKSSSSDSTKRSNSSKKPPISPSFPPLKTGANVPLSKKL